MRNIILVGLGVFLLTTCSAPTEKVDFLLGKWQVKVVVRGGETISGPQFRGTYYEFYENGTVKAKSPRDSVTATYSHLGDSLIYHFDQGQESYRIDSLTKRVLHIFKDNDGIPTTLQMVRIPKKRTL